MTILIRALLLLLAHMPRVALQFVGTLVGLLNFLFSSRSARVTQANLNLCMPTLDQQAEEHLRKCSLIETGKTMLETPAVWLGSLARIDGWIDQVVGEEKLKNALNSERGLLLLLPHMGNWELFNVFFRRYGAMTALYQPPRQEAMQPVMVEVRGRHGNEMVPTTRQGITRLYRVLKEGGTVVVLPDQVPASGRYVPFFNQMALTDELSVRLLQKTGAQVLGVCLLRKPNGRFDVHILEPDDRVYADDLELALTSVNDLIMTCAALDPAQYQWEYKRFRERPSGAGKVYRFNKPPGVHR